MKMKNVIMSLSFALMMGMLAGHYMDVLAGSVMQQPPEGHVLTTSSHSLATKDHFIVADKNGNVYDLHDADMTPETRSSLLAGGHHSYHVSRPDHIKLKIELM